MITTGVTLEGFITGLEAKLDAVYTDEQRELISSFGNNPIFCFADPGTGKTFTAIAGLITAECMKQIPGKNIYAVSFTRLATGELMVRHERTCKRLGMTRTVNFETLHSLCRTILLENYSKLGMYKFNSTGALSMEKAYTILEASSRERGVMIDPQKIRAIVRACSALNAALIFDKEVVVTKMKYKECNVDYETFEWARGLLFAYSLLTETISVSDLLLYTVMLLQRFPEVSKQFKSQCKLMLIDEAQDLSLLQLRIISLLTDNPVCIGDMKQQIYGFNGACPEVVQEFHKLFPNAQDLKLTQSFRCKNEIAEYATKLILANNIGGEDYKGIGPGGVVQIHAGYGEDGLNLEKIADSLKDEFLANRLRFVQEYLFLARNNISITPVIEELYKRELPFRVNKFQKAFEIPVIKDLCEIIHLAIYPKDLKNIIALRFLLPEFRGIYDLRQHPLYDVCRHTGCSFLEANYQYKNMMLAQSVMEMFFKLQDMLEEDAWMVEIMNLIWPLYEENWLRQNSWRLENKPKYYTNAVNSLTHKTYTKFINDEMAKEAIIDDSNRHSRGIRCYTMHASKGLEADVVYILDADEGIIPNVKKLEEMSKKQCDIEVARAIREERSLCYVACTRARKELHIIHNGNISPLISGGNPYRQFDKLYALYKPNGDDIKAFADFCDKYIPADN